VKCTVVIFDLDETLIVEYASVKAAFERACVPAVEKHGLDAVQLAEAVRKQARTLWHSSPNFPWCNRMGVASWEALAGDPDGEGDELAAVRQWMADTRYRPTAWQRALAEFGHDDESLAAHLAAHLVEIRPRFHELFPETRTVLDSLRGRQRLGLLTNGAPQIQRGKIATLDLGRYFETVVVSAEVNSGKPEAWVFEVTLKRLGIQAADAVMVGDSLEKDIAGAAGVGLRSIWVNRRGETLSGQPRPDAVITNLAELPNLLE
jgi:putative hydrolase of the HAD superfamily